MALSGAKQRVHGQNFFRSAAQATRFAAQLRTSKDIRVIEVGSGSGMVTRALARAGRPVIAVEIDVEWSRRLKREQIYGVTVVTADFMRWRPLPGPLCIVGNLPFGSGTEILRRSLELGPRRLRQGVFLLQDEYVLKRVGRWGNNLFNVQWGPWYSFRAGLAFPREEFRPVPRADTRTVLVEPLEPTMLPWNTRRPYQEFAQSIFTTGHLKIGTALRAVSGKTAKAWLGCVSVDADRRVKNLAASDWIRLYKARPETRPPRPRACAG